MRAARSRRGFAARRRYAEFASQWKTLERPDGPVEELERYYGDQYRNGVYRG
jgi:hypothetical protein